jgi:hypothetical protein
VGPGQALADLIASGAVPVDRLTEVRAGFKNLNRTIGGVSA